MPDLNPAQLSTVLQRRQKQTIWSQYDYFEYLHTEIPKHLDDTDRAFLENLLLWSPNIPANCRKSEKMEWNKTRANLFLSYRFAPFLYRYALSTVVYVLTMVYYPICLFLTNIGSRLSYPQYLGYSTIYVFLFLVFQPAYSCIGRGDRCFRNYWMICFCFIEDSEKVKSVLHNCYYVYSIDRIGRKRLY